MEFKVEDIVACMMIKIQAAEYTSPAVAGAESNICRKASALRPSALLHNHDYNPLHLHYICLGNMVTGVETAGLILGSIPLILAGLEFYAKGIAVTKRCWRYREEFGLLVDKLGTENALCVNSLNLLLIGVVRHKNMEAFIKDPCAGRWKEQKFEAELKKRLGTSYESYINVINRVHSIMGAFRNRLKLDAVEQVRRIPQTK